MLEMILVAIPFRYSLCFFGYLLETRLFVASGMQLVIGHVFVESISNAGMHESFGTGHLAGEKREHRRASLKEPYARRKF